MLWQCVSVVKLTIVSSYNLASDHALAAPLTCTVCVSARYNLIPILADILIDTEKEKVVRMCVATFRVRLQTFASFKTPPSSVLV